MKKTKVSIGISALNEEKNIETVLRDIMTQRRYGWELKEVLLYCDGCADKTSQIAKSLKNRKVKIFVCRKRKGKVHRVNQILERFKGDILVILDADIKMQGDSVIQYLVREFKKDKEVMLVGGNSRTFPPNNFFQRAIFTSFDVYFKSREKLKGGHNVFGCTGACLALRKKFAKEITIPVHFIGEDTYFYFSCIKLGYKFRHAKNAIVYYKMASSLSDFLRQIFRTHPESVEVVFNKHFGPLIKQEYKRPLKFYLRSIVEVFLENPLGTIYMITIKLACKPLFPYFSKKYKLDWFSAESTK
jgi:cellulose synthase/poly-beta-1,6-N-acetylglucosamine synthase-like glycosyltransferase